jgi:hypothetical protein
MPWSHGDCCDCGKYSGELFMLRPKLWKSLELTPTDCMCIACLSKRLGRPFTVSDFTRRPLCNGAIRGVLAANEALADRTAMVMRETGEARRLPCVHCGDPPAAVLIRPSPQKAIRTPRPRRCRAQSETGAIEPTHRAD